MTWRPPTSRITASPSCGRKPSSGLYSARRRVEIIDWSNTRATEPRKRASWRCSRANAFTTRTPETFSSASAVSSAIRCWTSCSAGRGLQREHRAGCEDERQRALHDEDQPVAEEEAHRLQVDGRARHQLPGLL